jgi:hypothetical protein
MQLRLLLKCFNHILFDDRVLGDICGKRICFFTTVNHSTQITFSKGNAMIHEKNAVGATYWHYQALAGDQHNVSQIDAVLDDFDVPVILKQDMLNRGMTLAQFEGKILGHTLIISFVIITIIACFL